MAINWDKKLGTGRVCHYRFCNKGDNNVPMILTAGQKAYCCQQCSNAAKKISPEIETKVIESYLSGKSPRETAKITNVNIWTIYRLLEQKGISPPSRLYFEPNQQKGKITILKRFGSYPTAPDSFNCFTSVWWICRCELCREKFITLGSNLKKHEYKYGCKECVNKPGTGKEADGDTLESSPYFRLYYAYQAMSQRCYNPKETNYEKYGKRGIKVSDEWLGSKNYPVFKGWALKNGWEKGLSLDRIDPDGNYCPDNCQWITVAENTKKMIKDTKTKNFKQGFESGFITCLIWLEMQKQSKQLKLFQEIEHKKC